MNTTRTDNNDRRPASRAVTARAIVAALFAGSMMLLPPGCEREPEDHADDARERLDDAGDSLDRTRDEIRDEVDDRFDDPGSP